MHPSNRNPFFWKIPAFVLWWVFETLSMTYVVLKGYLHDPIDCVKRAVATEPGRVYRKDSSIDFYSISIRLVLVSDFGSVSPFFRDELLAPVLHFVSVDRGERELSGKRIVTWEKQGGQPLSKIQHGFWQCGWTLMSIRMNHPFHGGKSLATRQEDSKLQILSFSW